MQTIGRDELIEGIAALLQTYRFPKGIPGEASAREGAGVTVAMLERHWAATAKQSAPQPQRGYSERPPSSRGQQTRSDKPMSDAQSRCIYALKMQGLIPKDLNDRNLTSREASQIISRAKGNNGGRQ